MRPGFDASRSVTTHEAVAPVAELRTITVVPIGSDGLAHWPARHEYQVARPVALAIGLVVVVGAGGAVVGTGATTCATVVGVTTATGAGATGAAVVVVVEVVGTGTLLPTSMIRRRCRCCWPSAWLAVLDLAPPPAEAGEDEGAPSRSSGRAIMAATAVRATA